MNLICIEEKAFDNLLDRMFKYVRFQLEISTVDKWIEKEAKRLLRIKSDTTLQKLRNEGQKGIHNPKESTSFMTGIPSTLILRPMPWSLLVSNNFYLHQLKLKNLWAILFLIMFY